MNAMIRSCLMKIKMKAMPLEPFKERVRLYNLGSYDYNDAIECFDNALKKHTYDRELILYGKALCLDRRGDQLGAMVCLDKALEIYPNYVDALNSKGLSLIGMENYNDVIECFDNALNASKNNLKAL